MKKLLLFATLLLCFNGILFAQEKSTSNIDELINRLSTIGTIPGCISEYFTSEEILLLQEHFKNEKVNEENTASNIKSMMPSKAFTMSNTQFGSFVPPSGEVTVISNNSSSINAGAINPNNPTEAFVLDNAGDFYSVDVTTGVYTSLGSIPGAWLGAEYNPVDGVLYAINDESSLYTIDTTSVTATLIGNTGIELLIALAIDGVGNAYSFDVLGDNFYTIDLNTGAATLIGSIGFNANFGQGMFWHEETDTVYITAFNNSIFDAELRLVNTNTGETILISSFGDPGSLSPYGWASSGPFIPGPDPQIINTWYLSEMTVELEEGTLVSDIFPPIIPTLVLYEDMSFTGDAACNVYMGDFVYHEDGNFFTVHNFDVTLNLCDYDSHNDFENEFFSYFGINAAVYYNVGGTEDEQYLILEYAPGYELIFQNVPVELSVDENNLDSFILYPNPTSDQLFIASEHYEIESVIIYSVSGKIIIELDSIEDAIDVSSLSEGMYFVVVSSSEGKSVQKFIKE